MAKTSKVNAASKKRPSNKAEKPRRSKSNSAGEAPTRKTGAARKAQGRTKGKGTGSNRGGSNAATGR